MRRGRTLSHPGGVIQIRQARPDDETTLRKIDAAAWTEDVSPAPAPPPHAAFFGERARPADALVAEIDGVAIGYAVIGQSLPLASHAHVLELRGLAVDPARQGCGAGRRLVEAAVEQARSRGARKLVLRVLGSNTQARRQPDSDEVVGSADVAPGLGNCEDQVLFPENGQATARERYGNRDESRVDRGTLIARLPEPSRPLVHASPQQR
jgi:ribosomal protein S18 acetylase RimI-like enzyme